MIPRSLSRPCASLACPPCPGLAVALATGLCGAEPLACLPKAPSRHLQPQPDIPTFSFHPHCRGGTASEMHLPLLAPGHRAAFFTLVFFRQLHMNSADGMKNLHL